ncbi:MAG: hypothetical protein KDK04_20230 [Candidatus Competibacteraceae bacterium]|nr:hypothetical protein [Candidatus Competibacteraceae bacterium]MCB1814021.1 hypothetical protein [Candidatus Competibacteraceae bacterium]
MLNRFTVAVIGAIAIFSVSANALEQHLHTGSAEITLAWEGSAWPDSRSAIVPWIQGGLDAVTAYFGDFPVRQLHLALSPNTGRSINGTAYPGDPPVIILRLGTSVRPRDLQQDWVLVHELTHLSLPSLARRHHWLEEGVATYIEPLIRHHSGLLDEDEIWRWLLQGTPKGLPQAGDQGLDFTPTWGRTYWGGALFCLLADLQIREQTNGRFSFASALRAISTAGGTMQGKRRWPIADVLAIGDSATGTQVLRTLYAEHRAQAVTPDLSQLWQDLGVALIDGAIVYDDRAPRSQLRKMLTEAP